MWRDLRAYFGLDGSASAADWRFGLLDVVPPMVAAFVIGTLDGVSGLEGWLLLFAYLIVCRLVWTLVLHRVGVRPPQDAGAD